jgi:hypothetical protein
MKAGDLFILFFLPFFGISPGIFISPWYYTILNIRNEDLMLNFTSQFF